MTIEKIDDAENRLTTAPSDSIDRYAVLALFEIAIAIKEMTEQMRKAGEDSAKLLNGLNDKLADDLN